MYQPSELAGKEIKYGQAIFQIEKMIGTGGFAYVYRAMKLENLPAHPVAIKVLNEKYAFDQTWRKNFAQEAIAHLRVNSSPQVASLHTFIDGDKESHIGFHMMIMEWVDGKPIDKWLLSPRIGFKNKLNIATQISHGLMAIHGRNQSELKGYLAHGDITPKNILITPDDDVKIIDFGLAWDIKNDLEIPKKFAGTISYIAPEQLEKPDECNLDSDIYSLGAVFYLLFSNSHYNPRLEQAEVEWKAESGTTHTRKNLSRFTHLIKSYPPHLFQVEGCPEPISSEINDLVLAMLTIDPDERREKIRSTKEVKVRLDEIHKKFISQYSTIDQNNIEEIIEVEDDITSSFDQSPFNILVAKRDRELLLDDLSPLRFDHYRGRGSYISQPLYTADYGQSVYGILHNAVGLALDKGVFKPDRQEFYFYVDESDSVTPRIQIINGERISDVVTEPIDLEVRIGQFRPVDILFILDRSTSSTQLENQVVPFINMLIQELKNYNRPYVIQCIFYGEYKKHPYGKSWSIDFDIAENDSQTLAGLIDFIEYHYQKRVNLDEKSYCGDLELALLKAADGTIHWRDDVPGYIVIIGSSPPHPTVAQQIQYGLSDYSMDEFQVSEDWVYLIDYLNKRRIQFAHLWLPFTNVENLPIGKLPDGIKEYIHMFSEYINSDNQFHVLEDNDFSLNQEVKYVSQDILKLQPYKLSQACFLPLLKPLIFEEDRNEH